MYLTFINSIKKNKIFTEEGQVKISCMHDHIQKLFKTSGAFNIHSAFKCNLSNTWLMMACIDRLVELGEIIEIKQEGVAGQNRVFVSFKD